MTPEAFAAQLNGREYPFDLSREEKDFAKNQCLVIVYGASDDLMEFRGAIQDELDCYNGGTATFDEMGLLDEWERFKEDCDDEAEFKAYFKRKENARTIEAIWDKDNISWQYKTDIPHATFRIMEDGDVYCVGIVFSTSDLIPCDEER